jgi:hypothetical protein
MSSGGLAELGSDLPARLRSRDKSLGSLRDAAKTRSGVC